MFLILGGNNYKLHSQLSSKIAKIGYFPCNIINTIIECGISYRASVVNAKSKVKVFEGKRMRLSLLTRFAKSQYTWEIVAVASSSQSLS